MKSSNFYANTQAQKMTKDQINRKVILEFIKKVVAENAPATAPSKPKEKPDVAEPPVKAPGKPKPRRPLGNPDVKPAPKATMNEDEMLKKIVKRFKSKK